MNFARTAIAMACSAFAVSASASGGGPLSIAQYPLFLVSPTRPNILIVYDNSESMDGTMAGKLIAGDDPATRGNIARNVIRNTINSFSSQFNWGLETFYTDSPGLYSTYPYWLGNNQTMVFTDDCVNGISASNGGLRCIANPQWQVGSVGDKFVTYDRASDDPDINDVLYIGYFGPGAWATTAGGGNYNFFFTHNPGPAFEANMANYWTTLSFTPTDAGYIPYNPPISRQVYAYRAWGFYSNVNGFGNVVEPVKESSVPGHLTNIQTLLANETQSGPDIKNSAVFTPLAGSLNTAQQYFSGGSSPIQRSCQKNFVLLATDGNPTASMQAWNAMYPLSDQINVYNPGPPATWTFSRAANDVFDQVKPLRNLSYSGNNFDIQTYVVGLGDTLANPGSVATLNQIAKLGGTKNAYLAQDAESLSNAFQSISVDIAAKTSSASAVSLNTGSWGTLTELYQARFNSGDWSGQMLSYRIKADGSLGAKVWDAGQFINTQNWDSERAILTYKPSALLGARGVPFRWPNDAASPTANEMDVTQSAFLNADMLGVADGNGSARVPYLRGSVQNELGTCVNCTPAFRARPTSKLGDIVHSAPNYVAGPAFGYPDSIESVSYSSFVAANAARAPTLYVGANDGMLHAFNAKTGKETLAYVPTPVYRNLAALTSSTYVHRYYVDASPTVGDVFYSSKWRTLLAGGLGAGGQGVYVLDVSDPANFKESKADSIVRWEFTDANDADLGYVMGQPLIVKTNNGRWSVIVANGYNSTEADGRVSSSGHAVLFVLDAETGAITAKIDTLQGSSGNPNGLSGPIAVDTDGNGTADVVYAGDLAGNLWKFDLTVSSAASWGVAFGGSPLYSARNKQAITVRPDVTKFAQGGYLVTFGTGRYLATDDPATDDRQTFYGIRDTGVAVTGEGHLVRQRVDGTASGADTNTYRITTHAVGPATLDAAIPGDNTISLATYNASKKGWYLDLPTSGERAISEPSIRAGRVIFNTVIPNTDECSFGGTGWVMEVDVMTGNRYDTPTFDSNGDKDITTADLVSYGGFSDNTSGRSVSSIPAAAGFLRMQVPVGKNPFENKYVNTSSGNVAVVGETAGTNAQGRTSWRQLQ